MCEIHSYLSIYSFTFYACVLEASVEAESEDGYQYDEVPADVYSVSGNRTFY